MKISNKSATTYQRSCAYCGEHELTKEHLIPRGYFDRVGGASKFLGNVKAGDAEKFLSIEPTISDVCRNCNNGVLSDLDNYFLSLFDRYLSSVVVSGQQLSLDLHFDELLRWLLKMGYNMGRARQWHVIQELARVPTTFDSVSLTQPISPP